MKLKLKRTKIFDSIDENYGRLKCKIQFVQVLKFFTESLSDLD